MELIAAMLAAAPPLAMAPPASPVVVKGAPDPAALDAARELLRSINFEAQMEQSAHQSATATFNTIIAAEEARQGKAMPADLKAAAEAAIVEQTTALVAELKKTGLEDAARIYARYFSADEIVELRKLQAEPVMKKAQAIGPSLFIELSQLGVRAAAGRQPQIKAALERVFADWAAKQGARPRS